MPKYFKNVAITLVTFVVLLANGAAWGQLAGNPRPTSTEIYVMVEGGMYTFYQGCSFYNAVTEDGTTWDDYVNLMTSKGLFPRFISHIAVGTLNYPASVPYHSYYTGPPIPVVPAVYAYWDYQLNSYNHYDEMLSGPDPSMNCHGYATEKNAWISIPELIVDDYKHYNIAAYLVDGAIIYDYNYDHSTKIDEVAVTVNANGDPVMKVVSISEKYRDSQTYKKVLNQQFLLGAPVCLSDLPVTASLSSPGFYLRKP